MSIDKLEIGNKYSKVELSKILNEPSIVVGFNKQSGLFYCKNSKTTLLFVTLDKRGKPATQKYDDYYEDNFFHWDSQAKQSFNTPRIQEIVQGINKIILFARINARTKSTTNPFVNCGELRYTEHQRSKPVHILFESIDYDDFSTNEDLIDIYLYDPKEKGKQTSNNINKQGKTLISDRIEIITKPKKISNKKYPAQSRIEAKWFKNSVSRTWNQKCALTGCKIQNILEAAHIVPREDCNNEERLNHHNGILFALHIHKLFDDYLISFDEKGSLLISKKISSDDKRILNISAKSKINITKGVKKFMKRHRDIFYDTEKS